MPGNFRDLGEMRKCDGEAPVRVQPDASSSWRAALVEAATRRDFPNLLYAETWIRSLSKAGMYPRWRGDGKGE